MARKLSPYDHARVTLKKVIEAYDKQATPISDADLDDEQPITITVNLQLGDIRKARYFVRM